MTAPAVDAVIVPSQFLAASAEAAGFTSEQIRVIPSGIDTEFFRPTPMPRDHQVIGFVGRFVAKKGIDTLMAAWPTIAAANPSVTLHMLGDGPLRHLVPSADPRITLEFPDETHRREQVRDLVQRSTVVVTPSHSGPDGDSESLLLVNLEAAASGRPVVSTTHGGIPEYVVDGTTGLLVTPSSVEEFSAAVTKVLSDRALAESLAAAGPAHAAQWDVRACTARIDALYDELLDSRK
jgi:glycosyltransferase involved in cell wall biosynthesis